LTTGGEPVPATVSIGVAALDAGSSRELTELLAAADAALYRAKASGRNQVQMISTSRGLSAVRSPVDDEPAATVGGAFRGPGALPPETGLDEGELGLDGEFGGDEFGEEFADDEFQVPDEGTTSTATPSAFAL
jgi:Diguanylate cyclase, GGDEF domain